MKKAGMKKAGMKNKSLFRNESGQAMVELAVALPILLLLVFGIIDFGWLFFNKMGVENASREGARYAIVNSDSATVSADVTALAKDICMDAGDTSVTLTIIGSNAIVVVTKDVHVLTPIAGIFVGGQTMQMSSTTKMRIN